MKGRITMILSIILIGIIILIITLFIVNVKFNDKLAIVISIIALSVSFLGVFKNEIFPFNLEIIIDDLIITADSGKSNKKAKNIEFVLNVSFLNKGYAEGIIEKIFVKVLDDGGIVKFYRPTIEIDYIKYIQGKRRLHGDNVISQFSSFPLHSKQSLNKYLVFQNLGHPKYPITPWKIGNYKFEVFVKTSYRKKAKLMKKLPFTLDEEGLNNYLNNNSVEYSLIFFDDN